MVVGDGVPKVGERVGSSVRGNDVGEGVFGVGSGVIIGIKVGSSVFDDNVGAIPGLSVNLIGEGEIGVLSIGEGEI